MSRHVSRGWFKRKPVKLRKFDGLAKAIEFDTPSAKKLKDSLDRVFAVKGGKR